MSDATLTAGHETGAIVARDQQRYSAKHEYNKTELIAHAARASGRGAFGIGMEAAKFRKGRQKIELDEYVKFRLYDAEAHSEQERGEFISWLLQNAIIHEVNDLHWFAVTEDKWLSAKLLEADGLPVPQTLGVIDPLDRPFHNYNYFPSHRAAVQVDGEVWHQWSSCRNRGYSRPVVCTASTTIKKLPQVLELGKGGDVLLSQSPAREIEVLKLRQLGEADEGFIVEFEIAEDRPFEFLGLAQLPQA